MVKHICGIGAYRVNSFAKKVVLFPEICRVNKILSLTRPHCRVCIRIFFFSKKKKKKKKKKTKKAQATKEEKRITVENLTGYDDIVCKFALCTFNLLDRVMNFSWLFI